MVYVRGSEMRSVSLSCRLAVSKPLDSCNGLLNFLIGARDRAFIVHLAPKHHCSCERSTQILGLFERRAPSECSSRPCAFQPPTKALLSGPLSQQALTRPPRPPSLEDEAQRDARAKSQMDRAFWERSREIGAQCPGSWFHFCRGKAGPLLHR
jgi:hypothetical protein